jgi:hypothetical protein
MIVHQHTPLHFIASCHDVKHLELMNVMNDFYLFIIKMIAIEIAMHKFLFYPYRQAMFQIWLSLIKFHNVFVIFPLKRDLHYVVSYISIHSNF